MKNRNESPARMTVDEMLDRHEARMAAEVAIARAIQAPIRAQAIAHIEKAQQHECQACRRVA